MTRKKTSSVFSKLSIFLRRFTAFKKYNLQIRLVAFSLVLADTLFIKKSYDQIIFSLIIIYIFTSLYQLDNKVTFLFCIALLCIMTISFIAIGPDGISEKAAVWLFLFIAIGIAEQWKQK